MEDTIVKDLMVPREEYATISEEATLFEAVLALEKAHERLDRDRYLYLHRAILVYDADNKIVGKVSQLDALKALEPKYSELLPPKAITRAGLSPEFLKNMLKEHFLWEKPLDHLCRKAAGRKVKEFMYTPGEGEYVEQSAPINQGIHMLIMGHHQSLLVTRGEAIVGVLRLTDVFRYLFERMKSCELEENAGT